MRKFFLLLFPAVFLGGALQAQTLFTYGNHSVSAGEFLRAFEKNNIAPVTNRKKAIEEYLDLYIKSRLKIREAYDRRMDTLSSVVAEVSNLRQQIAENFMNDPNQLTRLTKEAFARSQKEIMAAHIFISFNNAAGLADREAADRKKEEVLQRLAKEDFAAVARRYSDDTSARSTGGTIGYITAFTLPYAFENVLYNTPVGKISAVVSSRSGYHVFKNLGQRKASGRVKARQILLAIPPGSDAAARDRIRLLADSLYRRLLAGEDFAKLASAFSNDYITGAAGGLMPEAGIGQYDPVFEKMLFSLPKDGALSRPFETAHGWHIVKRESRKPVVSDPKDKGFEQELQAKIKSDPRWKTGRAFIYSVVESKAGTRRYEYKDEALWAYSDSLLNGKPLAPAGRGMGNEIPLYTIGKEVYTVSNWLEYAKTYRFATDGSGIKPWPQVREEMEQTLMVNYYREHLEDFSEEFRQQMREFTDGNIFFEIMQEEIWNKAQADTAALLALYEKNKNRYLWKASADAVIFFSADEATGKGVYDRMKASPENWREVVEEYPETLVADSSRFEWDQLPNLNKLLPRAGLLTTPVKNANDNTASFAFIIRVYPDPAPRNFTEAKGMVINDYQLILEERWNERLMKKYPVTIDKAVLAAISK